MLPNSFASHTEVMRVFDAAPFIADLGLRLKTIAPGRCETTLTMAPRHRQQDGFVHAGVLATVADHTAGTAGVTLIGPDALVLTAEFKINFLRPGRGEGLVCVAQVLKPGRTLIVVESEISMEGELVAKAMVTLAVRSRT